MHVFFSSFRTHLFCYQKHIRLKALRICHLFFARKNTFWRIMKKSCILTLQFSLNKDLKALDLTHCFFDIKVSFSWSSLLFKLLIKCIFDLGSDDYWFSDRLADIFSKSPIPAYGPKRYTRYPFSSLLRHVSQFLYMTMILHQGNVFRDSLLNTYQLFYPWS